MVAQATRSLLLARFDGVTIKFRNVTQPSPQQFIAMNVPQHFIFDVV